MEKLKTLYKKHRELISYVFFGGLTTLVSIITQFASDYFFVKYSPEFLGATTVAATTVSWICSVTFAFFVNKIFVFKNVSESKEHFFKQGLTFFGARLATYFLELLFMFITSDVLKLNRTIMKLFAQVFILIGNFVLSKFLIFKKK